LSQSHKRQKIGKMKLYSKPGTMCENVIDDKQKPMFVTSGGPEGSWMVVGRRVWKRVGFIY